MGTGTRLTIQKCQVRASTKDSSDFGSFCTVRKVKKGQVHDGRGRFVLETAFRHSRADLTWRPPFPQGRQAKDYITKEWVI